MTFYFKNFCSKLDDVFNFNTKFMNFYIVLLFIFCSLLLKFVKVW